MIRIFLAVFSMGHCVFSKVIVFLLFVSSSPNWELWKRSFEALKWFIENFIIAVLDFSCIICYLTFPFDVQLDDLNWYISSQLSAQHKAVNRLPWWFSRQRICLQFRRYRWCGFDPWVRKIPWRRKMAPHSSILAWKIPWTEEPGGLWSKGSQRDGQNWVT